MLTLLCVCFLLGSTAASTAPQHNSSYSGEYGGVGGNRFSQSGNPLDGPITAVRVRNNRSYITGIQVRYGTTWSEYRGGTSGDLEEIFLQPGEHISQVYGKYSYYIRWLVFVTSKGRILAFGKDTGTPFNAAPLFPDTYLRYISGSSSSAMNAIGFHWDYPSSNCVHCNK